MAAEPDTAAIDLVVVALDKKAAEAARYILGRSPLVEAPVGPETPAQRAWRLITDAMDVVGEPRYTLAEVRQLLLDQLGSEAEEESPYDCDHTFGVECAFAVLEEEAKEVVSLVPSALGVEEICVDEEPTAPIPRLSKAQKEMLAKAARRFGRVRRNGEDGNFTWVGRGQSSTAKKLAELKLGAYVSDGYSAKFWVWERGVEVARSLGLIT